MTSTARTLSRTVAIVVAILAVTFGSAVGMVTSASAHNYVVSSTPSEGAALTELPAEFDVTTNAPLLDLGEAAMQVTDAAGLFYGDGCVTLDGASIRMTPELGEPGPYSLTWQAVSEDGHTISGVIAFTWEPEEDIEAAAGSASAPVCGEAPVEPSAPVDDEPDASVSPSPSPTASADAEQETAGIDAVIPWIVGGAIVVVIATGVVLLLTRRRDKA